MSTCQAFFSEADKKGALESFSRADTNLAVINSAQYEIVDTIREMEQKGELAVRRPDNPEEVVRIHLARQNINSRTRHLM